MKNSNQFYRKNRCVSSAINTLIMMAVIFYQLALPLNFLKAEELDNSYRPLEDSLERVEIDLARPVIENDELHRDAQKQEEIPQESINDNKGRVEGAVIIEPDTAEDQNVSGIDSNANENNAESKIENLNEADISISQETNFAESNNPVIENIDNNLPSENNNEAAENQLSAEECLAEFKEDIVLQKDDVKNEISKCEELGSCDDMKSCVLEKIIIYNENKADIDNQVNTQGESGNNTLIQESGGSDGQDDSQEEDLQNSEENKANEQEIEQIESQIQTGSAVAIANVVNDSNVNVFGNNNEEVVINLGDHVGDIDVLAKFQEILNKTDSIAPMPNVEIVNNNIAELNNEAVADAVTGKNIMADGSTADMTTGNANAQVNVVNIANRNLVGDNWLFYVINVFGNWVGDLIVPGEGLISVELPVADGKVIYEVRNKNEADINNAIEAIAISGENSIISGEESSIISGDAIAEADVKNIVNINITSDNWFSLLINNMGSWTGKVMNWDGESNSYVEKYSYDFGTVPSFSGESENMISKLVRIYNENEAIVNNDVKANAISGQNEIDSVGSGNISTGDAVATANIVNFINTNIAGNNWLFGVVNVLGSWQGNAVFAYPDLSISITDDRDLVEAGESFNYTIQLKNAGKADCENAKMMLSMSPFAVYEGNSLGVDPDGSSPGTYAWVLPGLKSGEEKEFTISVKAGQDFPDEQILNNANIGVMTDTKEINLENNEASDNTNIIKNNSIAQDGSLMPDSRITVSSTEKAEKIKVGDVLEKTVVVKNAGENDLENIVVKDEFKDESGKVVASFSWNIPKIKTKQKVKIEYALLANQSIVPGSYKSIAFAYGFDMYGRKINSQKSIGGIRIIPAVWYGYGPSNPADIVLTPAVASGDSAALGDVRGEFVNPSSEATIPLWAWITLFIIYLIIIDLSFHKELYKLSYKRDIYEQV